MLQFVSDRVMVSNMTKKSILAVLVAIVASGVLPLPESMAAAQKKAPKIMVRFHLLADKTDSDKFAIQMTIPETGEQVYVSRSPALSEHDIVACYPFEAGNGTWGCAFYLSNHGRIVLDSFSIERRGSHVVALVGARQVAYLLIDRRISDGIITIPEGLTREEIDLMIKEFGVYGATREGSRT